MHTEHTVPDVPPGEKRQNGVAVFAIHMRIEFR